MTIVVSQHAGGSERFDKAHVEHVNISFTILDNILDYLKFIFPSVPLTPHQIGIGQEVTLISNTSHALKVFSRPIMTFEDALDHHKTTTPTDRQIFSKTKLVEVTNVQLIEEVISQLVVEGQSNLGLWVNISKT